MCVQGSGPGWARDPAADLRSTNKRRGSPTRSARERPRSPAGGGALGHALARRAGRRDCHRWRHFPPRQNIPNSKFSSFISRKNTATCQYCFLEIFGCMLRKSRLDRRSCGYGNARVGKVSLGDRSRVRDGGRGETQHPPASKPAPQRWAFGPSLRVLKDYLLN